MKTLLAAGSGRSGLGLESRPDFASSDVLESKGQRGRPGIFASTDLRVERLGATFWPYSSFGVKGPFSKAAKSSRLGDNLCSESPLWRTSHTLCITIIIIIIVIIVIITTPSK